MKMEELSKKKPPDMLDKKSLNDALVDRCHGEDYHFFVAVGKSSVEEKLYGAIGVQLCCNVPKDCDSPPIEEEWHSDLEADAYVDFLLVPDWARRNGVGTNLFECAERLAISKGMASIFMHGAGKTV
ncbi:hypothetical protein CTI12_AA517500 [Artemisia annua]|uniref:N-acetyltransferase domain-containing protein n=1 Tax=Artemisia annua TaxID=35608 RepID=A0A2U1L977_ARTAN|nr:hypothetical protein CTI12_AA517500 [Artemisia annua]